MRRLWRRATEAVRSAAEAVSDAVETAVDTVTEAVDTAVDAVGSAIEDGIDAVANAAENAPGVGGAMSSVFRWAADAIASTADAVGSVVRAAGDLVGGVVRGVIAVATGAVTLDLDRIKDGALGVAAAVAGSILVAAGKAVEVLQDVTRIQAPKRRLTMTEYGILCRVFHRSVALDRIRIVEGRAGLFGINDRAFVLGYTIYLKDHDVSEAPGLLVHECTHVWQYEHVGSSYTAEALGAQQFLEDAYDWEAEIARGNLEWVYFNREAQAGFLEHLYVSGKLLMPNPGERSGPEERVGDGAFYDADGRSRIGIFEVRRIDHTYRANRAVNAARHAGGLAGIVTRGLDDFHPCARISPGY